MGLNWGTVSLVILLYVPGFLADGESVTCIRKNICALRTSSVVLKCNHSNPNMKPDLWLSYKQKSKWSDETQPEDLTKDSDYAGRLEYPDHDTSLRIKDLKLTDSGEYQLMFRSDARETQIGPIVTLTVADVQLEMKTDQSGETVTLTCNTTCRLTDEPDYYYWYKDSKYTNKFTPYRNPQPLVLNRADAGIYTCAVSKNELHLRSSSVYVFVENAVKITYAGSHYCALESSSVEFPCNFSRPKDLTVTKSTWIKVGARDLQYNDRIQYAGDDDGTCTLRINNVKKSDSGKYYFQLSHSKGLTPGSELTLDVTGLQVTSLSTDSQTHTLTCITTCSLTNKPNYSWYKNGQLITNKPTGHNKLHLTCGEDVGNYTCAVEGHENLQSPPVTITHSCKSSDAHGSKLLMYVALGLGVALGLIFIAGAVWMWKKKSNKATEQRKAGDREQHSSAVYAQVEPKSSYRSLEAAPEAEENVQYASVQFKPHQQRHSSPNPDPSLGLDAADEDGVQYAALNYNRAPGASQ